MIKNKSLINIGVLVLLAIAVGIFVNRNKGAKPKTVDEFAKQQSNHFRSDKNTTPSNPQDPKEINRHPAHLQYTKHAKCRMQCRQFDDSEVKEILENGTINYKKSNDRPEKCPTYALEGKTHDGQQARMVFSFCDPNDVKLVTVIDLDTDWKCDCY
jgi:Domain of unknown function (DUF4258)